jgi:lysozyme
MRFLGKILSILLLSAFLLVCVYAYQYPQESLAYFQQVRKKVARYFYPPKQTKRYQTFKTRLPTNYSLHGIDVSHYQGNIDWEMVSDMKVGEDSISFAFIKATEGVGYFDKYFLQNWQGSKEAGLVRGAYHYFRPDIGGEEQARHFINHVYLEEGDLPPVLDIEETRDTPSPTLRAEAQKFLDILEKHYNITPIIYTSRVFYQEHLGKAFRRYPLWVAQYKNLKTPKIEGHKWLFWQHSYEATVNGINVPVDLNVFAGEWQDLKNLCKK